MQCRSHRQCWPAAAALVKSIKGHANFQNRSKNLVWACDPRPRQNASGSWPEHRAEAAPQIGQYWSVGRNFAETTANSFAGKANFTGIPLSAMSHVRRCRTCDIAALKTIFSVARVFVCLFAGQAAARTCSISRRQGGWAARGQSSADLVAAQFATDPSPRPARPCSRAKKCARPANTTGEANARHARPQVGWQANSGVGGAEVCHGVAQHRGGQRPVWGRKATDGLQT